MELLNFAGKWINNNTTEGRVLRLKILNKINITKVNDVKQLKELWPLVEKVTELKPMCLEFFKSLLVNERIFRQVFAIAKELKSEELEKVCCEYLAAATKGYNIIVSGLYLGEHIPDNVYAILKEKTNN